MNNPLDEKCFRCGAMWRAGTEAVHVCHPNNLPKKMKDKTNRLKILKFSNQAFADLFSLKIVHHYKVIKDWLPEDAEVIESKVVHNGFELLIRSSEFELVSEVKEIPILRPVAQTPQKND